MKKFILSVTFTVMLFMALGIIVEQAGAKLRSDQKALELISRARIAIGGDAALAEVRNLVIKGRTTVNIDMNGIARTETGETEIAFNLDGEYARKLNLGGNAMSSGPVITSYRASGAPVEISELRSVRTAGAVTVTDGSGNVLKLDNDGEFITETGKRVILRRVEGEALAELPTISRDNIHAVTVNRTEEAGEFIAADKAIKVRAVKGQPMINNDLARVALMLLMTPPKGMDVVYTFEGENNIDGTTVNTVKAALGGSSIILHLDKFSNLPVAVDYSSPQIMAIAVKRVEGQPIEEISKEVAVRASSADFVATGTPSRVKLSDYRLFNGIQLPYSWTTQTDGKVSETLEVLSYEINSANPIQTRHGQTRVIELKK